MRKLYKLFLNENITDEYLNEQFNYEFNDNCDKEVFINEYKKFLGIYNNFFYFKDRFVTVINSYEIRLNIKDLEQLIKLYLYSKENKLENERYVLLDFLYTYSNTINSTTYKNNYIKYKESKKDFEDVLNKFGIKRDFYNQSIVILYQFYKHLIQYAMENDIFVDGELINRVFNNLRPNKEYCNELIDIFINNNKNICNIVNFDNEKNKHLDTYLKYIIDSLNTFGGYNYAKEILFELDKSNCLENQFTTIVINKYVYVVNKLCNKLKEKKYSFIHGISEIENLKNELNFILRNIQSLNEIEKNKIKECLKQVLFLKRLLISDDEYVNREMHETTFQEEIKKEEIEKYKKQILDNELLIYAASKINFIKEIEKALEIYAKYPLQSIVSSYNIDSIKGVYSVGIESSRKKNNFKKFFDKIGKEYTTQKHNKLMNILSKDYYEELLRYLSKTFMMQQYLIISIIGKEDFRIIIERLKENVNYDYYNDYAIVVNNILAIEYNIVTFMKKHNIEDKKDGYENINNLVNYFKEDNDVINGLMYLNYILYEKSGLNLRNNAVHGTLINNKLDISLMVTFSGLIFVSWLLNEK